MSYSFLPLAVRGLLFFCLACSLFYYAIQQWNKQRRALICLYLTVGVGTLVMIVIETLEETTNIYDNNFDTIGFILFGYMAVILAELAYISFTCKPDAKIKKMLLIGWGLIITPIVVIALMMQIFP